MDRTGSQGWLKYKVSLPEGDGRCNVHESHFQRKNNENLAAKDFLAKFAASIGGWHEADVSIGVTRSRCCLMV